MRVRCEQTIDQLTFDPLTESQLTTTNWVGQADKGKKNGKNIENHKKMLPHVVHC